MVDILVFVCWPNTASVLCMSSLVVVVVVVTYPMLQYDVVLTPGVITVAPLLTVSQSLQSWPRHASTQDGLLDNDNSFLFISGFIGSLFLRWPNTRGHFLAQHLTIIFGSLWKLCPPFVFPISLCHSVTLRNWRDCDVSPVHGTMVCTALFNALHSTAQHWPLNYNKTCQVSEPTWE